MVGLATLMLLIGKRDRLTILLAVVLTYVLPGALYFMWRYQYYGHLLPLPFYVKATNQSLLAGKGQVLDFLQHMGFYFGIISFFGLSAATRRLMPGLLSAAVLVIFFLFPAHLMGFDWRYLFPIVPTIAALAAVGLGLLLNWFQQQILQLDVRRRLLSSVVVLGVCLLGPMLMASSARDNIATKRAYAQGLDAAHVYLGQQLAAFGLTSPTSVPVLAIGDAGAAPYYSTWQTIDTFGLNDPVIALSHQHDPEYIFSQHPDVLVLISKSPVVFEPALVWEQDLYGAAIADGMSLSRTLKFSPDYYLWVMSKPDTPVWKFLSIRK